MAKALVLKQIPGKPGQVFYPIELEPSPPAAPNTVPVHLLAASLNHRDLFQRRHLYPGIAFNTPIGSDGVGLTSTLDRVLINPGRGWSSSPSGPEPTESYATLGAAVQYPTGTFSHLSHFSPDDLEPCPPHLTDAQAAALPLTGLTAWRAVVAKARVQAGENVLVTGIGGGVALAALQFAHALGATVFVSSSSDEKLAKAKELGASAGVNYRSTSEGGWAKQLKAMLPQSRPWLDCVIDGAGGDIVAQASRLLKHGGRIVQYGMTAGPKMEWSMGAVLKNLELLGSTMGSRREFGEMVEFVNKKQLTPVVSSVVEGLDVEQVEKLFKEMEEGRQFGKLVCIIASRDEVRKRLEQETTKSKL